jgi:hypothetical protein
MGNFKRTRPGIRGLTNFLVGNERASSTYLYRAQTTYWHFPLPPSIHRIEIKSSNCVRMLKVRRHDLCAGSIDWADRGAQRVRSYLSRPISAVRSTLEAEGRHLLPSAPIIIADEQCTQGPACPMELQISGMIVCIGYPDQMHGIFIGRCAGLRCVALVWCTWWIGCRPGGCLEARLARSDSTAQVNQP